MSEISDFVSGNDIKRKLKNSVKVITYKDLLNYPTIESALEPNGRLVILYEQLPNIGHWVCLYWGPSDDDEFGTIYFFDSYGIKPDDEQHWIDVEFRQKNWQDRRYLSQLLAETPAEIEYNEYPLQGKGDNIGTCGKWVIARLMMPYMNVQEFGDLWTPDEGPSAYNSDTLVNEYYKSLN
jgi:hypothetical protein